MTPWSVTALATIYAEIFASLVSIPGLYFLDQTTFSKDIHIEDGGDLLGFNMYRTTLAYIICKNLDEFETSCDLTVDTIDDELPPKNCPKLFKEGRDFVTGTKSRVFLFDNDQVIVVWAGYNRCSRSPSLKLFFVLQDDCEVKTSVINLKSHRSIMSKILESLLMLRSKSGFEMLYNDTCRDVCLVTFDNEGTKLYESRDSNPTGRALGYFVHPAEADSNFVNSGYCFLTRSEERLNASLLFTEDSRKVLSSALSRGLEASSIKASIASAVLSLCWQNPENKKILSCSRGNPGLKLELEFLRSSKTLSCIICQKVNFSC